MEKHSFPLQEEATEQTPHMDFACLFKLSFYAIPAAFLSSVKQGEHTIPSVIQHFHCSSGPQPLR